MKCCSGDHDSNSNKNMQGHEHMNHMWMMLLCCLVPLAILFLLFSFGNSIPAARNIMLTIVPFLCPVLMLLMMLPMLLSWRKEKQADHNHYETRQTQD